MKIILKNTTGEFTEGCEYTVIEANKELVALVAKRALAALRLRKQDDQFDEVRYWDYSPECITADNTGWPQRTLDRIERVTDQVGPMLLPKKLVIPDPACERIDLCRMVIECHKSGEDDFPCLYWEFNLKNTDIIISTQRINLDELEEFCVKSEEVKQDDQERIEAIVEALLTGKED